MTSDPQSNGGKIPELEGLAHSEAEIEHLKKHGANIVVMGEHEIAKAMLRRPGMSPPSSPSGA